jgi:predicted patatin/cPLA2 family phospholipase
MPAPPNRLHSPNYFVGVAPRDYPPSVRGRLFILIFSLLLTGCGALKSRTPVPKALVESATLVGYEDVRYWGDEPSRSLSETFIDSWKQERTALKLGPNDSQFPNSHYLAISGGGQNGAFGAGVLCGWTAGGTRPTFKVVTGISTGALTAPFAFLGPEYDDKLREVYTTVDEKDIAIFQGFLSLLRSDSAYDTAPLSKLAKKLFDEQMLDRIGQEHLKGRRLLIGTTDLDAGRPVVWDIGKIALSTRDDRVELFRKVLLASAAIPAAFPPIYLKVQAADGKTYDEMHVDGGVTRELFMLPSELHLFELRARHGVERRSHLFIIRNSRFQSEYEPTKPKVGNIAARSIDTLITSQAAGDLWTLYYEAKENNMTYAVTSIPQNIPDNSKSLFDRKYMTNLFNAGYDLARAGKAWRDRPYHAGASTTEPTIEPTRVSKPDKPIPLTQPSE